jgi:hypothetical protein
MGSVWKRVLGRHANALGFWSVLILVALAFVLAAALTRGGR